MLYYRTKKENELKFEVVTATSVGAVIDGVEYELSKTLGGELMLSMHDRSKSILLKPLGRETVVVSAT